MPNEQIHGIDVSHHNGHVDWQRVANTGIGFAFAKASEGSDPTKPWYTDSTFATNWTGMADAGITRGAYHFVGLPLVGTPKSKWNDDLHSQIDHFLEVVGPLQDGDLTPCLDFENGDSPERWQQLIASDRDGAIGIVRELIKYTKEQVGGQNPIIYTGSFWWSELSDPDPLTDDLQFTEFPLWFAQYPRVHQPLPLPGSPGKTDQGEASSFAEYDATPSLSAGNPRHIPRVWRDAGSQGWTFWQFSASGVLSAGVSGFVDLDVFRGSSDQLQQFTIAG